jgi:Eco57I restriction-modification methylase
VSRATRARGPLPLFACEDAAAALREVVPMRACLAATPDDTAEAVRAKERLLADTRAPASAMTALRRVADLWCACWFWSGAAVPQPGPAEYGDLAAALRSGAATLPERIARPRLDEAQRIAGERRFLHWTLEFPEVFFDASGAPLDSAGFDAIIGNPPWDMVRGDTGDGEARRDRRSLAAHLTRFVRQSGVYRACAEGHANQYQLFAERSLSLLRDGGRLGLVLPWGLASDHGSAALRRLLFERCATDTIVGFENAAGIFPIHRGVRFLLLSTSPGRPTRQVRCRFGERDPTALDDTGAGSSARPAGERGVTLTPALLRRLSGPGLAIPYLKRGWELQLVERLVARWPALGDERGWGARFGRELNRSDDRPRFSTGTAGIPVVEGKHVDPFDVRVRDCEFRLAGDGELRRAELREAVRRQRLAYRDVASATNRLTLIAAIVPAGAVTVHTLYCLKGAMPADDQAVLCCLLNSFVANYLVRMWVTTHLGTATVERLPVPRPAAGSWAAGRLRELGRRLLRAGGRDAAAYAEAQGVAAHLYGLSQDEFERVLASFPLVEPAVRAAAAGCLREVS